MASVDEAKQLEKGDQVRHRQLGPMTVVDTSSDGLKLKAYDGATYWVKWYDSTIEKIERMSSTPARPVAMATFKPGDQVECAYCSRHKYLDASGRMVQHEYPSGGMCKGSGMTPEEMRHPATMFRTLSVGFKVDGDGPYTRESMIAENTGPMVDEDPEFIAWLKSAQPGQSKNVAIGGGWTKVEAVNMAVTMASSPLPGNRVRHKDGREGTVRIGGGKMILVKWDAGGESAVFADDVTKTGEGTPQVIGVAGRKEYPETGYGFSAAPRLFAPVPYARWLSRLGWRDTAENRAHFARMSRPASGAVKMYIRVGKLKRGDVVEYIDHLHGSRRSSGVVDSVIPPSTVYVKDDETGQMNLVSEEAILGMLDAND